ncbi:MAG: 3-hydroxyacyl-CoA dehydrogenase, partial [Sinorhizobium fredii]|nr:3-hydroxyacyl-CoA dehydrogenase [Sinorhizobium fredii]
GARILADGTALRASDIDLVKIHGYGFPRWRGGPMHYAQAHGLDKVVDALGALANEGLADPPCDLLLEAARHGGFADASL